MTVFSRNSTGDFGRQVARAGLLAVSVYAVSGLQAGFSAEASEEIVVAQTSGMERRDDRQGGREEDRADRQDCRQAEGVVGSDKRECKRDDPEEATTSPAEATTK